MGTPSQEPTPAKVGRYHVLGELASGGMATVNLGHMEGPAGFSLTVAIKRLHREFASQPEFIAMLRDEARLAGRVRHPNVVPIIDVVEEEGTISLVMEYVRGEALASLLKLGRARKSYGAPPAVASAIVLDVLAGLHAAHEATGDRGEPLGIVHRDISPQNVLVGADGVSRLLDFGIAKAAGRLHETLTGIVKGKAPYMSPEQARGRDLDRRTDVYAAGVVLWETLTGRRLFTGKHHVAILMKVFDEVPPVPSSLVPGLDPKVDAVVLRALSKSPEDRFANAKELALALEAVLPPASPRLVSEWVMKLAGSLITARGQLEDMVDAATDRMSQPPMAMPLWQRITRHRTPLVVAAALLLLVCIGFAVRRALVTPAEARPAIALVQPAAPPVESPSTTTAPLSPAAAPVASATASSSRRRGIVRPVAPAASAAKPNCDPPYRIDAEGIHVPKPECL